jgi:hypothetical protein
VSKVSIIWGFDTLSSETVQLCPGGGVQSWCVVFIVQWFEFQISSVYRPRRHLVLPYMNCACEIQDSESKFQGLLVGLRVQGSGF